MRYPRHLTLELTAKCNFRCPYCYCVWHEYPALAKPELDADQWKAVLDQCAADGVDDILFTGGEALLRSDLFAILDHARRILPRARLSLFTNASRLDETLIKRFRRRKVHLATSLQGLKTYGAMTGTRRSYRRLLAVVARAAELKWPIAVSITVTKANLHEAADMFVAAALSGAKTIQVGPVILGGRAAANQELMVSRDEWEAVRHARAAAREVGGEGPQALPGRQVLWRPRPQRPLPHLPPLFASLTRRKRFSVQQPATSNQQPAASIQ